MALLDLDRGETQFHERRSDGWGGRWYGVMPATVSDISDPDGQGRVKVKLDWSPDGGGGQGYAAWARMATLFAGNQRGSWFIPDVGDEVLIAFEHGDPRRPYVLGGLWNGKDKPPQSMASGNALKVIRSRNGVKITLDDSQAKETLILETPGGQKLTMKDGPGAVTIEDSNGNSVKLETAGITVTAAAKVTVNAAQVAVSASMVKVDAGMSIFSGVVKCDTLISNTVISTTYTPGAGNIW
ncbi:phage baseplate assembly protein V [Sphingomonas sp. SUN019]|uniref:phage baseplate assembly protein V n=1 Tax=Sphingomonas sp. SUN019 TaxID=2937788 RepID=UPI0021647D98|nr:phage baseplate assembly protein V [Sphingomonas sp. SUN019]UVO51117.1 phage baseplate assembly protein V [Sphingomonas sp. SUN019]